MRKKLFRFEWSGHWLHLLFLSSFFFTYVAWISILFVVEVCFYFRNSISLRNSCLTLMFSRTHTVLLSWIRRWRFSEFLIRLTPCVLPWHDSGVWLGLDFWFFISLFSCFIGTNEYDTYVFIPTYPLYILNVFFFCILLLLCAFTIKSLNMPIYI